jgi:hypothetical protein
MVSRFYFLFAQVLEWVYVLQKKSDVWEGYKMRTDYKKLITEYIAEQNYDAIVEIGQENNAKALRFVQMNIWGDYRKELRWYALSALEQLAKEFASEYDEVYRNVIRRAVWAMADESGNVPWAAPEMMAVVIKAAPAQYKDFVKIMVHNGLDSPMCHHGVLWAVGYLGKEYYAEIEPFMPKLMKFLDAKDDELRGLAIWALKALQYEPAFDKINSMAEDTAVAWIYEDGILQQKTIGQIMNKG